MGIEKWDIWFTDENVVSPLYTESVVLNKEGLFITFLDKSGEKRISFGFKGTLYSYRVTDESSFLRTLDYLIENYPSEYFQTTALFKVRSSEYLEWFKKECCDLYTSREEFEHYVFYTEDEAIEVLSPYPPTIKIEEI